MVAIRRVTKSLVPQRYHGSLREAWERTAKPARPLRRAYYRGANRYCPICDSHVRTFLPFGVKPKPLRPDARCPVCGSLERHRLLWLYLNERTDLFRPPRKRLLHVAPERVLAERFLQADTIAYLSADLESPAAMVKMDITQIQYPDSSFDAIICNHVLEHVPDDRRAMRELFRVLKPGGWAILGVPIGAEVTFEDAAVRTPQERERVYGQRDHVRIYGRDYVERLASAGFSVTVDRFGATLDAARLARMGLSSDDIVHFCAKRSEERQATPGSGVGEID